MCMVSVVRSTECNVWSVPGPLVTDRSGFDTQQRITIQRISTLSTSLITRPLWRVWRAATRALLTRAAWSTRCTACSQAMARRRGSTTSRLRPTFRTSRPGCRGSPMPTLWSTSRLASHPRRFLPTCQRRMRGIPTPPTGTRRQKTC